MTTLIIYRYGRNYEDNNGRNVYFEWDPKNYKNEALNAEVYETRNDNYRANVQKRMLHPDGVANYPVSQLYTPESQKISSVPVKPGVRAPVLQYAHPELGVQPAKIVKNEKRRPDSHIMDNYQHPNGQYPFMEQRQKKKYVLNDKNIVDTYTTKNYYPNQHFYGLKRPTDTPFWVKISENLKNQFSSGVEKVSQFARPVFDPLVEATHKISQNLGLSNGKEAQDKIGTVASGTSILIPALGLVASGAALGIGAVAVGRYLDVDVLKRSNDDTTIDLEHKRAMVMNEPSLFEVPEKRTKDKMDYEMPLGSSKDTGLFFLVEQEKEGTTENLEKNQRNRRSLDYLDIFNAEADVESLEKSKRLQRKGADSITEIVEIDLPPVAKGNIDVTELLIPRRTIEKDKETSKEGTIFVIGDDSLSEKIAKKDLGNGDVSEKDYSFVKVASIIEEAIEISKKLSTEERDRTRRKRSNEIDDQELDDILQNLENAEIAEIAHINGDWTNTPCAKRIFCDTMIQKDPDASIFMEKKMAKLLGL